MEINQYNRIEIDGNAVRHNLDVIQKYKHPKSRLMAIVKSNAYGHGLDVVAPYLQKRGVAFFGVHSMDEAVVLRKIGIKQYILVMGPVSEDEFLVAQKYGVAVVVHDIDTLKTFQKWPFYRKRKFDIHLKIETGMNRLGMDFRILKDALKNDQKRRLSFEGLMSHIPDSLTQDARNGIRYFKECVDDIKKMGYPIKYHHVARSALTFFHPESHCDFVRVGISLYGYHATRSLQESVPLEPILSLKSKIVSLKAIRPGETVGYDRRFTAKRHMKIGVVPIGYGDGYHKLYGRFGKIIINDTLIPIVGDICMNMLMVDMTMVKDASVGNDVILIGKSKSHQITAYDLSEHAGFIPYEVLTSLSKDIKRVIVNA